MREYAMSDAPLYRKLRQTATTPPTLKLRVQSFEFGSCVGGGELPMDAFFGGVSGILPRFDLAAVTIVENYPPERIYSSNRVC